MTGCVVELGLDEESRRSHISACTDVLPSCPFALRSIKLGDWEGWKF